MPTWARKYRTTYHRTKAQKRWFEIQELGYSTRHATVGSHLGAVLVRGGCGGDPGEVSKLPARQVPAALTSRAGCSHGGATRTAPRPPSRFRRAPTRLFSVPKIQDSDPASQSQRTYRPPPVTLPHADIPLYLLWSLTDRPVTNSPDAKIDRTDRSMILKHLSLSMPAKSIRWHCPARATLTFVLQISQIPRAIRLAVTIFSVIPIFIEIDTRVSSGDNS